MKIMHSRSRLLGGALLALMVAALVGCATNPATGKRQLHLMSRSQSIELGNEAKGPLTEEFGGAVPNAALQAYVTEVGMKLAAQAEADYPSLPWEFTLLDSEVINAFALPGGKVFITRGLAERFTSEAQLAAVLGHEVGHVTGEHVNERLSKQIGASILLVGVGVAAGSSDTAWVREAVPALVGVGAGAFMMKFSRDDELESDRLGMRYAARAGYEPAAMIQVMEVLAEASGGGSSGLDEFFSTHPLPATRIDRAKSRLRDNYPDSGNASVYRTGVEEYRRRMLEPLRAMGPAGGATPQNGG